MTKIESRFHCPEEIGPVMREIKEHASLLFNSQDPGIFNQVADLLGSRIAEGMAEDVLDSYDVNRLHSIYGRGAYCLRMREDQWSATERSQDLHFRLGISAIRASFRLLEIQPQPPIVKPAGRPLRFPGYSTTLEVSPDYL